MLYSLKKKTQPESSKLAPTVAKNPYIYWLVVDLPLWKIWVRQLGWWHSQYMERMLQTTKHYNFLSSSQHIALLLLFSRAGNLATDVRCEKTTGSWPFLCCYRIISNGGRTLLISHTKQSIDWQQCIAFEQLKWKHKQRGSCSCNHSNGQQVFCYRVAARSKLKAVSVASRLKLTETQWWFCLSDQNHHDDPLA